MKKSYLFLGLFILGIFLLPGLTHAGTIKGKASPKTNVKPRTILVYVDKVAGVSLAPSQDTPHIDQKNIVFAPHILPIVAGTSVEFRNSDNQKHNVFGIGDDEFNLGTWDPGVAKPYTFNKPGVVTLLCNIHSEMEGYVVVLQNPYFALTDDNGDFLLKDVPAGNYQLKAWHERLKPAIQNVVVPVDGEVEVNFELTR